MAVDDPDPTGAPPRPTLANRLEYALVRVLAFVLTCTDVRGAARIGSFGARLLGTLDRRHRRIAVDNILRAWGEGMSRERAERLALRVYGGLGVTAAEFAHGPRRLRGRARRRWLRVRGAEAVREVAGGGPVVFVSAHFGNWEQAIAAASLAGFDVVAIARPLGNPLLNAWISRTRRATGTPTVAKHGALRELIRAARGGKSIAMLMDQNANRYGVRVPFFGLPTSTIPTGVALARRLGLPLVVGTMERTAVGAHVLDLGSPMFVGKGRGADGEALLRVNLELERRIRRRPADWLWLHRRWRIKDDWNLADPEPAPATEEVRA